MTLFRGLALSILLLAVVVVAAQDDTENWITYISDLQLYRINADGGEPERLSDRHILMMRWASNGEWFLIASNEESNADIIVSNPVHLFRVDGTNFQQITSEPIESLRHLAISPDNEWIVYTSCPDGYMHNCQLYKIRSDGTDFAHVDASPGFNQYLSWSPDSAAFLFTAYDVNSRNIYQMNPEAADVEVLTEGGTMAWSPDGEWIAFVRENGVYRMRPDGTDVQQLTTDFYVDGDLSWSPDSEWLLFEIRENSQLNIYRMNADGTDQKPLAEGRNPVISPDGEWILLSVNGV